MIEQRISHEIGIRIFDSKHMYFNRFVAAENLGAIIPDEIYNSCDIEDELFESELENYQLYGDIKVRSIGAWLKGIPLKVQKDAIDIGYFPPYEFDCYIFNHDGEKVVDGEFYVFDLWEDSEISPYDYCLKSGKFYKGGG